MKELTTKEQQKYYDELCGKTYVNLFTVTKDHDCISIAPFNPKNKEHLFILYMAKGLAGVVNKDVHVDTNRFQLWKLNRGVDKACRFKKLENKDITTVINPDSLLHFMRPCATEKFGKDFSFGDIYDEFFAKKGNK